MSVFIERIRIKNYKSIPFCDVELGALNFLIGRNGTGKSNFVDALAFIRDALLVNLDHALRIRGGVNQVRRRSSRRSRNFGLCVHFNLTNGHRGSFAFELGSQKGEREGVTVRRERCTVGNETYETKKGKITHEPSSRKTMPPVAIDRLYLAGMAAYESFRPLYDALCGMRFYNIDPEIIKKPQPPDAESLLRSNGANIATVLSNLDDQTKTRIGEYFKAIAPFVSGFNPHEIAGSAWQTVEFLQESGLPKQLTRFSSINMSAGTLRALGILTALLQTKKSGSNEPTLIGVEEPETALHTAALSVLMDAIDEASEKRQVIITTHSTELVNADLPEDCILAVGLHGSETHIGRLNAENKHLLAEHLTTPGELLRQDMLQPDAPDKTQLQSTDLFKP